MQLYRNVSGNDFRAPRSLVSPFFQLDDVTCRSPCPHRTRQQQQQQQLYYTALYTVQQLLQLLYEIKYSGTTIYLYTPDRPKKGRKEIKKKRNAGKARAGRKPHSFTLPTSDVRLWLSSLFNLFLNLFFLNTWYSLIASILYYSIYSLFEVAIWSNIYFIQRDSRKKKQQLKLIFVWNGFC